MKEKIHEVLQIPGSIECLLEDKKLKCRKDSFELSRPLDLPNIIVKIDSDKIVFESSKSSKRELKIIKAHIAHIKNMFLGLQKKFLYKLEACNVHFPMSLKVESGYLIISNFLGEKVPRRAKIIEGVDVEIKGAKITISSQDKEAAGQTAANIEKATRIGNRDRRIFQDGIFIVEKPEEK